MRLMTKFAGRPARAAAFGSALAAAALVLAIGTADAAGLTSEQRALVAK